MKKIINQPDNYIKEMLEGIYIAHKDDLACVEDVYKRQIKSTKRYSPFFFCE